MSKEKIDGGCKTSEVDWPPKRDGEWHHSDYKDVPYQNVFSFYKRISMLSR